MISARGRGARSECARRELAARIMDGTFAPGAPLRIAPLSAQLGMSATPLREALNLLAGERLVEYIPMRGFFVTQPPDDRQVEAMGEARLVLEPALAALAAQRATDDERAQLTANLERTGSATAGSRYTEYETYLQLSSEFHASIAKMARSPYLSAALAAVPVHALRFRRFGEAGVDDAEVSVAEHRAVAEAVLAGDPPAAREAMAAHVRGVTARA